MEYRIEHDTMGEVRVPAEHFWGAQTERSLENFRIGTETIPRAQTEHWENCRKRKPEPSWTPVETSATASIRRSFH